MFYVFVGIVFLIYIMLLIYIVGKFKRANILTKVKDFNKQVYYLVVFMFILLLLLFTVIDPINTFTVYFHFFIFSLIVDLVFLLFRKSLKFNIPIIIAILITAIYFGIGAYNAYHVKKTTYNLETTKEINDFKIALISDVHLGTTFDGAGFQKHVKDIVNNKPDLLVITGDFVDDDTKKEDMILACSSFKDLNLKYGIYFVFGNHDKGFSNYRDFNEEDLRKELTKNGVIILEDLSVSLGDNITLIGRQDKQISNRKSIKELVQDIDSNNYTIVLDHEPNDYEEEANAGVDLVLSGHTHGGQMIPIGLAIKSSDSIDNIYGLVKKNDTNFIVTSGISDWVLKFKTGTFSEYVIINVKKVSD